MLGQVVRRLSGATALPLLLVTSLSALPVLGMIVWASLPRTEERFVRAVMTCANPAVLALFMTGAGWAAPALYLLWLFLSRLPRERPQRGMVRASLSLALAARAVPAFAPFLPPLFAALFFCAPPALMRRYPVPFYLEALAPTAMLYGALAYTAWIAGTHWGASPLLPAAPPYELWIALAALSAGPGLLQVTGLKGSGPRLAALLTVTFAAAWGADLLVVASMAALAQSALAARRGEPLGLTLLSFAGGGAVVLGLGAFL